MISIGGRQACSAVHQLTTECAQKWTEIPLYVVHVICRTGLAVEQVKAIKLSIMKNTSTAIVRMGCTILSEPKAVLN